MDVKNDKTLYSQQSLLGSMLISPEICGAVFQRVKADDFGDKWCREAFKQLLLNFRQRFGIELDRGRDEAVPTAAGAPDETGVGQLGHVPVQRLAREVDAGAFEPGTQGLDIEIDAARF